MQSVVLPGATINLIILSIVRLLLLLLSGDVELNPGPTLHDKPNVKLLIQWLDPLVEWKQFGTCLPGMSEHDIQKIAAQHPKIEDQKLALYSKWLSINPKATWNDVITTLASLKENTLAQNIKDHVESDALSIASMSPQALSVTQSGKNQIVHTNRFTGQMQKFNFIYRLMCIICR